MIKLPKNLVSIKYPGYFYDVVERKMYSCKVNGVLTPLKLNEGFFFKGRSFPPGWVVSHKGRKIRLVQSYLDTLEYYADIEEEFPIERSTTEEKVLNR